MQRHFGDQIITEQITSDGFSQVSQEVSSVQAREKPHRKSTFAPKLPLTFSKISNQTLSTSIYCTKPTPSTFTNKDANETHRFNCRCSEGNLNCFICAGNRFTDLDNELVKFLDYILEFKLGKKAPYQRVQNLTWRTKSTPLNSVKQSGSHLAPYRSSSEKRGKDIRMSVGSECRIISESTMVERCQKEKFTHERYNCDYCNMAPIIGTRYHCRKCEDFDLCQKCYERQGHQHDMSQHVTSKIHSQMVCVVNSVSKSQRLKESNPTIIRSRQSKSFSISIR